MKKINFLAVYFILLFITFSNLSATTIHYKIGVLSLSKKEQTLKKWEQTAKHLSNKIPNSIFTIIPMTYNEINFAMINSKIDFLLTNPAHYIIHEKEVHLFRLATVIYSKNGHDISSFGGVIVTLKENNKINTIKDLKNKKIAAVKKDSLGGYQAQIKQMLDNGVSLPSPQKVIFTDMPHRNTLDLLLDKKVDLAFLRTSVLEKLSENNEIDIKKLKIINKKKTNYPFFISTELYPEWPFAALSHISNETKQVVAQTLFNIKQNDLAAIQGKYKGWYIPLDYNIVTELLKKLKLPPFDKGINFTLFDIIKKYTNLFILFIIISIVLLTYLLIVNISLYKNRKILKKNTFELKKLNNNLNTIVEKKVKELRDKDQKLLEQSKMASMGEMIGNIAHQWRQPLSIISTLATGIQLQKDMNTLNNEKLDKMLNQINDQSQFLSQTIDTFQNFIKEDKKFSTVILQDRIDKTLNIISTSIKNHHIQLINHIDYTHPIYIKLVIGELSQVIMNIINNGKDILKQREIQNPWISIDLHCDEQKAVISIEDNGGGIEDKIKHKIFEPYFTTKHKSQGTGLGLHMSYKIVTESLKGKLWVKNTQNGAKFFIELPLQEEEN